MDHTSAAAAGAERTSNNEEAWKDADFLSFPNDDGQGDGDGDEGGDNELMQQRKGGNGDNTSGTSNAIAADGRRREYGFDGAPPSFGDAARSGLGVGGVDPLPPWMDRPHRTGGRPVPRLVQLHNEIVDFVSLIEPQEDEIEAREGLVREVTKIAEDTFGGPEKCKVVVFGSQATGLFLPTSDIDMVVQREDENADKAEDDKGNDDGTGGGENKSTALSSAAKEAQEMETWDAPVGSPLMRFAVALQNAWKDGDKLSYLEVVEKTRIPIVKFTHRPTGLSVDVCFNQPGGPEAAELMNDMLDEIPPLRPLCFVLKYFTACRGINEPYTGGIGSFLLQMMIVSYLQNRAREEYNSRKEEIGAQSQNLGSMLLEFLELYGVDFNYVTTAISIRRGGFYFPKGARPKREDFFVPSRPFSLAVENPLDPSLDVGRGTYRMQMIQRSFEVAFRTLLAHTSDPPIRPPATSVLATVLPPNDDMRKRATLRRVLDANASSDGKGASSPSRHGGRKRQRGRRRGRQGSDMDASSSSGGSYDDGERGEFDRNRGGGRSNRNQNRQRPKDPRVGGKRPHANRQGNGDSNRSKKRSRR